MYRKIGHASFNRLEQNLCRTKNNLPERFKDSLNYVKDYRY